MANCSTGPRNRRLLNGVEFFGEPGLELYEVFIAWREQTVVLEQASQMRDVDASAGRVEAVMAELDVTGGQPGQQRLDFGVTLPGVDAFGSVDSAEDFRNRSHGHRVCGTIDNQSV